MTETITINITEDDIANGTPSHGKYCPSALALRRELGTDDVSISYSYGSAIPKTNRFLRAFGFGKSKVLHLVPEDNLSFWMINFDARREVEPGTFKVEVSEWK